MCSLILESERDAHPNSNIKIKLYTLQLNNRPVGSSYDSYVYVGM